MGKMTVEKWVELFKDIGLSDKDMQKWHEFFEKKYPKDHQSFLEWLGLNESRIDEIRSNSK